jgi:hypothetical protein
VIHCSNALWCVKPKHTSTGKLNLNDSNNYVLSRASVAIELGPLMSYLFVLYDL